MFSRHSYQFLAKKVECKIFFRTKRNILFPSIFKYNIEYKKKNTRGKKLNKHLCTILINFKFSILHFMKQTIQIYTFLTNFRLTN